jgi:transitional endoplasmic reticulum ATPase
MSGRPLLTRMADSEPFTFITSSPNEGGQLFDDFRRLTGSSMVDLDVQIVTSLREKHPELIVT